MSNRNGCQQTGMCTGVDVCSCVHPFSGAACSELDGGRCWGSISRRDAENTVYK